MTDLRARLALLAGLALLGIGLAVTGATVDATDSLRDSESPPAFVVSDQNVTFEAGDQQTTVVGNMERVDSLEVEQTNDKQYTVHTATADPVSTAERRRAKEITRDNETIQRSLAKLHRYELTVDPIHTLTAESSVRLNGTVLAGDVESDNGTTYTFDVTEPDGSVVVDRQPDYVDDEVAVRVSNPATDELYFSVIVDLETNEVVDTTGMD
ncbi:hypothetical protein KY092_14710 [Natronomonas gomsonensis]|uniref:hypothetical protein n=1 Tax=Natronomonas gomsonensis TaxID=1046043 RepID=UPI0020CA95FD|nr:hypothetical protein [Natronomonas gomsonensis]MCY4731808.1 hypothetical protein [Natronomonas gomsonensis]